MLRFNTKILEKKEIAEGIIILELTAPKEFTFEAGQYIQIRALRETEEKWKAFSMVNPPSQKGKLTLLIKLVEGGFASEFIRKISKGDTIEAKGPMGLFKFRQDSSDTVMIATGTGIAPIYSILLENINKKENSKRKFTLIYGAKAEGELAFKEELESLEKKHKNLTLISVLSRQEWKNKGHVQEYLPEKTENKTFYICGLKEMVLETKQLLLKRGVKEEDIKTERYN